MGSNGGTWFYHLFSSSLLPVLPILHLRSLDILFVGEVPVHSGSHKIYSSRRPHIIAIRSQASSMTTSCLKEFKDPGLKWIKLNLLLCYSEVMAVFPHN